MSNLNRLQLLRRVIAAALLVGILSSLELWFPSNRSFPRIPLVAALPETIILLAERLLCAILIISLVLIILTRRATLFSATAIASLGSLIFFDQMRLQPWIYQYLLLLGVLTLHDWHTEDETASNQMFCLLQFMMAALYFWSGVQKLNFSFAHETLPILLTPLENILPATRPPLIVLGLTIALAEVLIGCGLLLGKTRNLCVLLAVSMHVIILVLLVAKGYNSIVWAWNAVLIFMIVILFWKSDVSFPRTITVWRKGDWKTILAKSVALACSLLPILSFWGWWDMYLSGALYSGNTAVAVIRINEEIREKLPQRARQQIFQTKSGGEQMLPLLEWAMADLNVPVYPEPRIFKQVTVEICKLTKEKSEVELVVKQRPAIFDGSYQVRRITCDRVER